MNDFSSPHSYLFFLWKAFQMRKLKEQTLMKHRWPEDTKDRSFFPQHYPGQTTAALLGESCGKTTVKRFWMTIIIIWSVTWKGDLKRRPFLKNNNKGFSCIYRKPTQMHPAMPKSFLVILFEELSWKIDLISKAILSHHEHSDAGYSAVIQSHRRVWPSTALSAITQSAFLWELSERLSKRDALFCNGTSLVMD